MHEGGRYICIGSGCAHGVDESGLEEEENDEDWE
jgi:hypothetical protein